MKNSRIYDSVDLSKRFIVFAYDTYYPGGGLSDVVGSFDTVDEAKTFIQIDSMRGYDWKEIFDTKLGVEIGD